MLAGVPGVKADRMVIRYVERAVGATPGHLGASDAAALVRAVAELTGRNITHLDHAIWRFESGRPTQRQRA